MATITFDTLQFARRLKAAGVSEAQAEAFAEAFKEAQGELEFATKADLRELEQRLRAEMAGINGKLTVLIGLNIAMALAVIGPYLAKLFV